MGQVSFRDLYEAATAEIPEELVREIRKHHPLSENQLYFLSLLLRRPQVVRVGEWRRNDRKIHFPKATTWFVIYPSPQKHRLWKISEESAIAVVTRLNIYLTELGSPFRVWYECRKGDPRCRSGPREKKWEAPFRIGAVDTRRQRITCQSDTVSDLVVPRPL